MAETRPTPVEPAPSMLTHYMIMMAFTMLGIYCSTLVFGPSDKIATPLEGSRGTAHMSCDQVRDDALLPPDIRMYMGTKLRYQFGGVVANETEHNGCTAVKVFGIVRHGARYPTVSHIRKWNTLSSRLHAHPSTPTTTLAKELMEWVNPFNQSHAAHMTNHGLLEQYCLGQRFLTRFPSLLGSEYNPDDYSFRSSRSARTIQSGLAFARGMFEGTGPVNGYQPIHLETVDVDKDDILRYDELPCPLYDRVVTDNKTLHDMLSSYLATEEFVGVVRRMQEVFSNEELDSRDVISMYKICIHETSVFGTSKWCDVFSLDDLSILHYHTDLKAYWIKGPGFPVTRQRSVHLLEDIVRFLDSDVTPKVVWRFAHAETLLPLLSLLMVANDNQHLLHNNYKEMLNRHFSTSALAPFSGNIILVKYSCYGNTADQVGRHSVRLLVNEQPIRIENCSNDDGVCSLEQFITLASVLTNDWTSLTDLCSV